MEKGLDSWVVTVHGPNGAKQIELPREQVEFWRREIDDPYTCAAYLAYLDLWVRA